MNDDKPKSIWKKSWKGPRGLLLWFILLTTAAFLAFFTSAYLSRITQPATKLAGYALISAASAGVVGVLVVAFVRWLCSWRNFRRFLFGLACLVTLIALFYAEEDWRGKHDWDQFKHRWEAKGEHFSFASVIPPPVPDDQNFAFSPVWIAEVRDVFQTEPKRAEAWYGDRIYRKEVSKLLRLMPVTLSGLVGTNRYNAPQTPEVSGNWAMARMTKLKPWQSYYRGLETTNPAAEIPITPQPQSPAQDVLLALSKFNPVIEKLQEASLLPYSRFPIDYNTNTMPAAILLPHLAALKQVAQVLQLRAIAELQNGQSNQALVDVKLMLCLVNSSRSEPFLISHLVRMAILQIAFQPIYEGLAEHSWSDAQLAELDRELAKLDFLADYESVVRGGRAVEIANLEFIRHPPRNPPFRQPPSYFLASVFPLIKTLSDLSGWSGRSYKMNFQTLALGIGPSGWVDQNELRIAQFATKWCLPIMDPPAKTVSPAKARAADNALEQEVQHRTPENLLVTLLMPPLATEAKKFAYAQESVDLARVAIALERYRLVHGEYPKSLDPLAPQFIAKLPHDVINGQPSQSSGSVSQPLHYRCTPDGQFVLYSVGWNETDDGGAVVLYKNSSDWVDITKGDWVWRYPQK